jgi:hypothetical protein
MARQIEGPRKQRTRQHVIADLSVNYVERLILEEGHSFERPANDYGYDLVMRTHDPNGFVEESFVYFQLESSDNLIASRGMFSFDLDVRDYNLWRAETMPVILILFDAIKRRGYWLHVQEYFRESHTAADRGGENGSRPRQQGATRQPTGCS